MQFPEHKCGLFLTHNEHKDYYLTVSERLDEIASLNTDGDCGEWPDDAERQKSIETNELWELQWYPNTPICFYKVYAATLERLLEFANRVATGDDDD